MAASHHLVEAGLYDAATLYIVVDISSQQLSLCRDQQIVAQYPVSTSSRGAGCAKDSFQTPTGLHRVAEMIGDNEPAGSVFEGRVSQGCLAEIQPRAVTTGEDLITSRILWLQGMEPGINQGSDVDSKDRYIYIHGTNEEGLIGQPVSHGCVRMTNSAVIDLYDQVKVGTPVVIV